MKFDDYLNLFDRILLGEETQAPYDDPSFYDYVKLNKSRLHRWLKNGAIMPSLKNEIRSIDTEMHWELITEPWCGDAAHSVPFIAMLTALNARIQLNIQLRDSDESEIEHYLTNGGKSIPKLIVRDAEGKDLFTWGPRPVPCIELLDKLTLEGVDPIERKKELQTWYNSDKGQTLQAEILELLKTLK